MQRKTLGSRRVIMLLFLLAAMGLHISLTTVTRAGTSIIRVPDDFSTIQEAINAAQNGSTILVDSGVYYEHLTVNKSLTLLGADKEDTIIDGSHSGSVITITSDNVTLNGFTIRNSSNDLFAGADIDLYHSVGSVVSGNVVTLGGWAGIEIDDSSNDRLSDNIVSSTIGSTVGLIWGDAIRLTSSANNTISGNIITNCTEFGINLINCQGNLIAGNTILGETISIDSSTNNTFFHNDFFAYPGPELIDSPASNNSWSIGGEGNYWDDYTGLDDGSGGRVAGDGVGDTNLPWHGADYNPLISPANSLLVFWNNQAFAASIVSNSTVSTFTFDQADKKIAFDVTGPANSTGYVNMSIPVRLLSGPWTILLDGADATSKTRINENQTYTTIYLNYNHSAHSVQVIGTKVIPEYPAASPFLLLILLAMSPTILIVNKRKKRKT
jgi:parallel beta-helix repeat protein